MKQFYRRICLVLSALILLSAISGPSLAARKPTVSPQNEIVTAIVLLDGEAAANTDTNTRGAQQKRLAVQHRHVTKAIAGLGLDWEPVFDYSTLLNGMAIRVDRNALERIAALDGVKSVHIANHYAPPETIKMDSSNMMTGVDWMQNQGFTGSGTVIAVLDTGITTKHEAFAVYDGMLETPALQEDEARSLIQTLGYGQYLSKKIPFAYDYADRDNDASDNLSGHGTHVASIAAGYAAAQDGGVSFLGTAPDAQILAMKIFSSGDSTGTDSAIYFKALEDAYLLGADVINMSLGSPNGFTYDYDLETEFGNIYETLRQNGVICVAAAGNEGSMADYALNRAEAGQVTSDYMDYGVVGTPSTYLSNLSVASANNASFPANAIVFGGNKYPFYENDRNDFYTTFAGTGLQEYVVVPGVGETSDYAGLDAAGRIALVQRGVISFQEKLYHAADAGAAGILVYNNQSSIIYMTISDYPIPAASISKAAGEAMITAAETQGESRIGSVEIPVQNVVVNSEEGWLPSDFSSWGTAPDLSMKPAVTGIGGNVYAAAAMTGSEYVLMSGTSMATPNVSGALADLCGYLKITHPEIPAVDRCATAEALLESTARILSSRQDPEMDSSTKNWVSPRKQGAGLIDLKAAGQAQAYVVDPLIQTGDSPDGAYALRFHVKNLTDRPLSFQADLTVLTDEIQPMRDENQTVRQYYDTLNSVALENGYTVAGTEYIRVPASGIAQVCLELKLDPLTLERFQEQTPNGSFVEGYATLKQVPFRDYSAEEPCVGDANCPGFAFADMPASTNWAHAGIDYAVLHGLFNGTSATAFSPSRPMTRAMLVAVLYRLAGSPDVSGTAAFTDVKQGAYYEKPVIWAAAHGIVNGTTASTFSPNANITRQQMAAILYRYAGFAGYSVSERASLDLFPDQDQAAAYARDALGWAVHHGIITGNRIRNETLLDPKGNATRAQVAAIFMRFAGTFTEEEQSFDPGSDLHATFMGFCGDWTKAPILEAHDWRELAALQQRLDEMAPGSSETYRELGYTLLDLADFEVTTGVNTVYASNLEEFMNSGFVGDIFAGDNPLGDAPYRDNHIAISHNSYYTMLYASPMQLRNARHLIMVITDAETGEVYTVDDTEYLPKTVYDTDEEKWTPSGMFIFEGTDLEGNPLPDGTRVNIDYYANLDYKEDLLGRIPYDQMKEKAQAYQVWSYSASVDDTAPSLLSAQYNSADRSVTVTAKDEQYLSAIILTDWNSGDMIEKQVYSDLSPGESHSLTIPNVKDGRYLIELYDYAGNCFTEELSIG